MGASGPYSLNGGEPLDVGIVCALRCEAAPLLKALELTPAGHRMHLGRGVGLAVSGVGGERAAAAVRLLARHADASTCWLNLGCAGGRGPLGELVVAHRVSRGDGEGWYPQFPFRVDEKTVEVRSVDRPETRYAGGGGMVYEMEASDFYARALEGASLERVHVLKVLTDGPEYPVDRVTAEWIESRVGARTAEIRSWVKRLRGVAGSVRARRPEPERALEFLDRWHFTASQRIQLDRLLERLRARSIPLPRPPELGCQSARAVLRELTRRLRAEVVTG